MKILIKIISSIQDKISLLLLLSKIVLKFINFHTHFAVRLPQQRFFFFLITVIQLINYLKLRDTISVIIFICTIYLIFFISFYYDFEKFPYDFCNHSHHNLTPPHSRITAGDKSFYGSLPREIPLRPGVHRSEIKNSLFILAIILND